MSYDLFLKPRGDVDLTSFERYFSTRRYWEIKSPRLVYQNKDTGVYFTLNLQSGDDEYPVSLNINYFRPSYFGLEAEREMTALVKAFDMTVFDPQVNGMGRGEYSAERFLKGWNSGNEFGYLAILRDHKNRNDLVSFPTDTLVNTWKWNYARADLQRHFGDLKFVPKIMFFLIAL